MINKLAFIVLVCTAGFAQAGGAVATTVQVKPGRSAHAKALKELLEVEPDAFWNDENGQPVTVAQALNNDTSLEYIATQLLIQPERESQLTSGLFQKIINLTNVGVGDTELNIIKVALQNAFQGAERIKLTELEVKARDLQFNALFKQVGTGFNVAGIGFFAWAANFLYQKAGLIKSAASILKGVGLKNSIDAIKAIQWPSSIENNIPAQATLGAAGVVAVTAGVHIAASLTACLISTKIIRGCTKQMKLLSTGLKTPVTGIVSAHNHSIAVAKALKGFRRNKVGKFEKVVNRIPE